VVRVTDGSCHNNVQVGLTEGEREKLGTRPKFLNQRHYIIQHMLQEVRHADGVRRPPLVDQSPRVLERHNVDLVRIQSVSRHRKNLSHKTALPVLLRIVFSIAALSNHSTKPVLVVRLLAAVVCISGRLSLSLTLPLTQIPNSCGLVGPCLPLLVAGGGITEFGHFCRTKCFFMCYISLY